MITVYIASAYTKGDVAINVRESFLVADELLRLGYAPFPPLFTHFWHFLSPKSYDTWVTLDNEWVLRCDCLLRLPGESKGADAEVELAIRNNIPVFYGLYNLTEGRAENFCGVCGSGYVRWDDLSRNYICNVCGKSRKHT